MEDNRDKKIEDYLHLYLPFEVEHLGSIRTVTGIVPGDLGSATFYTRWGFFAGSFEIIKPTLRPLSDMSEEEGRYYTWLNMDSEKHLSEDTRISIDEIDSELIPQDGSTLVDGGIVCIFFTCRCFLGQLVIDYDGTTKLYNESDDKYHPVEHVAENVRYLLSKHFDLFGLIEAGLAIDKTTLKI